METFVLLTALALTGATWGLLALCARLRKPS